MSLSRKFWIITAAGIAMALLVAVAVTLIEYVTGYNVFGFNLYLFVPVGAIATGAAAASGYYLACSRLQMRPGIVLVVQMLVVAAVTNLLIYYFEYLAVTWGYPVAFDMNIFAQYLADYFTHQELAMGRGMSRVGQVGDFGYWLAGLDFLGFLVGGALLVSVLRGEPKCPTCNIYYSRRARRNRFFRSERDAAKYYEGLFAVPLGGPEFAEKVALGESALPLATGNVQVKTTLLHCPQCRQQRWQDQGEEWNGKAWKELNQISRAVLIPKGVDMASFVETPGAEASKTDDLFATT